MPTDSPFSDSGIHSKPTSQPKTVKMQAVELFRPTKHDTPVEIPKTTPDVPLQSWEQVDLAALEPPKFQIPGYDVLREISRGSFGVVYLARQLPLSRLVALKVLRALEIDANDHFRFHLEANIISSLQHPFIVQLYEFSEHEGMPYFAMEYIPGGNLHDKIGGRPQPRNEAAFLVKHMAMGIHYAHERGIIHRDLKPGNVLISEDGMPKIVDFGMAKYGNMQMTASGMLVGTFQYMAPEQTLGKARDLGPSVDIYALGAILYEMLTGVPVVDGIDPLDIVDKIRHEEPERISHFRADVPSDLETICFKCLQKEPHRRYKTAYALAEDLRLFLEGKPITARRTRSWEYIWFWCKRNPLLCLIFVAFFLLFLSSVTVSTWLALRVNSRAEEVRDWQYRDSSHQEYEAELQDQLAKSNTKLIDAERSSNRYKQKLKQQRKNTENLRHALDLQSAKQTLLVGDEATAQSMLMNIPIPQRGCEWDLLMAQIWQNQRVWMDRLTEPITQITWTTNSQGLILTTEKGVTSIWKIQPRKLVPAVSDWIPSKQNFHTSPDGRFTAQINRRGDLILSDRYRPATSFQINGHLEPIRAFAFAPDGYQLATMSASRILLHRLPQNPVVLPTTTIYKAMAYDGRTNQLWRLKENGVMEFVSLESQAVQHREQITQGTVQLALLRPDLDLFVTTHAKGILEVFRPSDQKVMYIWQAPTEILCLDLHPNGTMIAVGGSFGVQLLPIGINAPTDEFSKHRADVISVRFLPNESDLVSIDADQQRIVWDWRTEKTVESNSSNPFLGLSDGSKYALVMDQDGGPLLLDLHKQRQLWKDPESHASPIRAFTVCPEEKRLLTVTANSQLHVWDLQSGIELLTLATDGYGLAGLAWKWDESALIALHPNGTSQTFPMPTYFRNLKVQKGNWTFPDPCLAHESQQDSHRQAILWQLEQPRYHQSRLQEAQTVKDAQGIQFHSR